MEGQGEGEREEKEGWTGREKGTKGGVEGRDGDRTWGKEGGRREVGREAGREERGERQGVSEGGMESDGREVEIPREWERCDG